MTQNINTSKLSVYLGLIVIVLFQTSCVKDFRDGETDFSGTKPVALIAEGGLSTTAFGAAALTYPGTDSTDTATFHVNYAADNVAPASEDFTLAIDQNAIKNYNATGGLQYVILPDSDYTFTTTKVTVAKGNNYVAVKVVFHPNRIDPSKNYMLPITITAAPSGTIISGNQATIYYHAIGNPIAGAYEEYWSRWNGQSDSSGGEATAAYYKFDVGTVIFSPNSPTQVQAASAGTGETDIIDFVNNGGVLSNFNASFPSNTATALQLTSIGTPTLEAANPATGYYRISFGYVNGSGAPRFIINEYIKL